MPENLNDLRAFVQVAQAGSFTKAAGQMGLSQSALSYTIRALEQRVGMKLLHRTTRSVSPTAAGERLLKDIEPLLRGIEHTLGKLNEFRETPRGTLRINCSEHVAHTLLWDKLVKFARDYPDVVLEISTDYAMVDIVKDRFDIGIRLGGDVDKDMIAVQVAPALQMALVAVPAYLQQHGVPAVPADLAAHRCLTMRLPRHDNIMSWEFRQPDDPQQQLLHYRPQPALVVSHAQLLLKAALDGLGLAWLPLSMVEDQLRSQQLRSVLDDWALIYDGYYLYYPSRNSSPLFNVLVEALRLR